MRRQRDNSELLSGSILKHVFRLALPMIVAFMFVTSYHFIDRYFVSQLGDVATAAIGMAFIVQMVVIAIGVGVGSGVNSYIARNLGAGDEETAKSTVKHAFYLAAGIGAVLGIAGLILQKPLFLMLGAEGELLELIVAYLTIIFIFTPVNLLAVVLNNVYQGWGDTMSPMKFMLLGNFLNLIFDPLLIFGYGPFPELGIAGAGYATAIGRCAALLYLFYKLLIQHRPVQVSLTGFRPDRRIIRGIFQVGFPSTLSQVLTSVAMGFVFWVLNPFGTDARTVYTIVFTYEMVVFLPAIGISQAVSILTGHNFGARQLDRVNQTYGTGIAVAFGMMAVPAAIIFLSPHTFAGIFARDPHVLELAARALRITAAGFAFSSIYLCSVASFQGLGLGRQYLIANLMRLYFLQVPFTYFGAQLLQLDGVWGGLMAVNIISALVLLIWHRYIFNYQILSGKIQPL